MKQAVDEYEKKVIFHKKDPKNQQSSTGIDIEKILNEATEKVWASDPESKELQEKLLKGSESIDHFIIAHWNSGLDDKK
jgi:flagellar hook-basal body complex protein FliE